jgi:hypothetical protein
MAWQGPLTRFQRLWFVPGGSLRLAVYDDASEAESVDEAAVAVEAELEGNLHLELDGFASDDADTVLVVAGATIERCQ